MSRHLRTAGLALVLAFTAAHASAAQRETATLPVRTFHLKQMHPDQAAKLISPYVQGVNSGAFSAGDNIRAITVRASASVLAVVDSVLQANDHKPATVMLRFQLIAAEDSVVHDAAIADVDAALRGLFRFRGYRLLAEGAAAVAEGSETFSLTMNAASEPPQLARFTVTGQMGNLTSTSAGHSVDLRLNLTGPKVRDGVGGATPSTEFFTGLTVPIGQTVVLGSAAASGTTGTVILAVRAELVPDKP